MDGAPSSTIATEELPNHSIVGNRKHRISRVVRFKLWVLYLLWGTVPLLGYCTSCGVLFLLWGTVPLLGYCTSFGVLYLFWGTVPLLGYCTYFGVLHPFWGTARLLRHCLF